MHHPSWILPWGVPLQKMVAVPIHPAAVNPHHPGLQLQHHPAAAATVHVPPGAVIGLPPTHLGTLRTFVAATQPTQRPRKVSLPNM